jgi:peptide/nickel transport system ATP-binding protein
MNTVLVETQGLKRYFNTPYGKLHAVDGIDLKIEKGKTLGVVGESGCGKSTLGRTILKLTKITAGRVLFDGEDITPLNAGQMRRYRTHMQMIFQDPCSSINPRMTVRQLIAEPILINRSLKSKADINRRLKELMDLVGIPARLESAYPHELDGGRRQRVGIARALSVNPEFIVCDEPVSALDVSIRAQILNLLMDLQKEFSLTYLFITHDMSVVKHISDEIMVLYMGQCVEQAETDVLFSHPLHPYTRALLSSIPSPDFERRFEQGTILQGEISSPIEPFEGCRFHGRCPLGPVCDGEKVEKLYELELGHWCACKKRAADMYDPPKSFGKSLVLENLCTLDGLRNILLKEGRIALIVDPATPLSADFRRENCQGLSLGETAVKVGDSAELVLLDEAGKRVKAILNGAIFTESKLLQKQKLQGSHIVQKKES